MDCFITNFKHIYLFGLFKFSNSNDCSQLVIDTYELHSGINIPEVDFVNCYYDEKSNTRISIYDLNTSIDLNKFELLSSASPNDLLQGLDLLGELERPTGADIYLASGEKWGTKWTYAVDTAHRRLWAELNY
ncbi:MAG: hypothetical protein MI975_08100 [Cytophagales bacterium]|nr:hypothetical protein [Cytophagales bacterium]